MSERRNANGLTLREGLEAFEKYERDQGAFCNAELLKWAREEVEDLRNSRSVEIEAKCGAHREIGALEAENKELRAYLKAFCAATIEPEERGKDVGAYEANPFIEYQFTCLCDNSPRTGRVLTGGQVRRAMELVGFDKLKIEPADKTISQELTEARDCSIELARLKDMLSRVFNQYIENRGDMSADEALIAIRHLVVEEVAP